MSILSPLNLRLYNTLAVIDYYRFRHLYNQHIVFIAGHPKAGSTWLRNLFVGLPGFRAMGLHHVTPTDNDLRPDSFRPLDNKLAALRLHTSWSPENAAILRDEGLKYCVIYRDLRDVVVSWYFFVTDPRVKHYLYPTVSPLNIEEGISYYISRYLAHNVQWIRDWRAQSDPAMCRVITYEELRKDSTAVFGDASRFCLGTLSDEMIGKAIEKNRFERLAAKAKDEADHKASASKGFARKGIVGDWRNHFTAEHKRAFKEVAGEFLIELGYEQNTNW